YHDHQYLHSFPTRRSSDLQIISHVPPHAQPIRHLTQKQTFGADVFEKHHQLELEKDHRINGWSPSRSVILAHEIVDKREIQRLRSEEHTSELQSRFDLVCR